VKVAIHQPNFLPWLGFFAKIAQADVWIVLDDAQFSRGSYTNRVRIAGGDGGADWLTLPVRRTGEPQKIADVRLESYGAPDAAIERLYRAYIGERYGADIVAEAARTMNSAHGTWPGSLAELNVHLASWIVNLLRLPVFIRRASSIIGGSKKTGEDRLVELCREVNAREYVSGQGGGTEYHDPAPWQAAGIKWTQARFRHPTWPGMPELGVSIVDLLARHGPAHAKALLEESIR